MERKHTGGTGRAFAYALGMVSYNVEYLLLAQLNFALTESYAISAISAGLIFLVSRIFDGITDVFAGYFIDRFNPKVGKARVYDLLHVPLWICLVLVFSVPNFNGFGKLVWVFIFYNLLQSVIATFMNVAEPLRLQRSFTEEGRMKAMTVTSVSTILVGIVVGIVLPQLIGIFGAREGGWTIITGIFAVPMVIVGMLRFFFLPELPQRDSTPGAQYRPPKILESLKALVSNKYALLYGGVMMCWAMYNTVTNSSQTYYFQYIYGDISAASIVSLPVILSVVYIMFIPKLANKFGKIHVLRFMLALSVVFCLARLLFPTNIIWLTCCSLFAVLGTMTLSFFKPLLTIDCITYGKWRTKSNVEAAYSTVNSLTDKIGLGLGSILLGGILQISGYNGTLEVQSESAIIALRLLYTVIPAVLLLVAIVCLAFYDLEKILPEIERDNTTHV